MTVTIVFGTRPEAIKLGPVVAELRELGVPTRVLCTGQHRELLTGTPAENDLAEAEGLALASDGRVLRWLDKATRVLQQRLGGTEPSVVVVQGDTMSALAGARAAVSAKLPLVHVEAGVRSHNMREPWPEEAFRVEIDGAADWFFAPTTTAYANLVAEGHAPQRIAVTGNSVVSALARYTRAAPVSVPGDHMLVTLHRREFLQSGHFVEVLDALAAAAADHAAARFFWPMHPAVTPLAARWLLALPPNLVVSKPMAYRETAGVLAHAFGVLTDSGGLIEEAATLGTPSVQLRNVSDRPEAIEVGVSRLEAPTGDGVYRAVQALTTGALPRRPSDVYGGVDAAAVIARALEKLDVSE